MRSLTPSGASGWAALYARTSFSALSSRAVFKAPARSLCISAQVALSTMPPKTPGNLLTLSSVKVGAPSSALCQVMVCMSMKPVIGGFIGAFFGSADACGDAASASAAARQTPGGDFGLFTQDIAASAGHCQLV